jgi:hypothetical protein
MNADDDAWALQLGAEAGGEGALQRHRDMSELNLFELHVLLFST